MSKAYFFYYTGLPLSGSHMLVDILHWCMLLPELEPHASSSVQELGVYLWSF
jgi:hypothetical protein